MSVVNECVVKGMKNREWQALFGWRSPVSAPEEDESFFLLKQKSHSAVIAYAKSIRAGVRPPELTINLKNLTNPQSPLKNDHVNSACTDVPLQVTKNGTASPTNSDGKANMLPTDDRKGRSSSLKSASTAPRSQPHLPTTTQTTPTLSPHLATSNYLYKGGLVLVQPLILLRLGFGPAP